MGEFRKRRPDARKIPPIAFTYIAARYANSHDDCIEDGATKVTVSALYVGAGDGVEPLFQRVVGRFH